MHLLVSMYAMVIAHDLVSPPPPSRILISRILVTPFREFLGGFKVLLKLFPLAPPPPPLQYAKPQCRIMIIELLTNKKNRIVGCGLI